MYKKSLPTLALWMMSSSCNFSQNTNERICFSILKTHKYLKLEIKIQVSSICAMNSALGAIHKGRLLKGVGRWVPSKGDLLHKVI